MKILNEVGLKKIVKYALLSPIVFFMKAAVFPPIRILFLKALGASIGKETIIHDVRYFNFYRCGFAGLNIGNECFIGDECMFDLAESIEIEDQVTLAERILILTHQNVGFKNHPLQEHCPNYSAPVKIKAGSFIGANTTILGGVTIGPRSIIGAGSVVTKDIPPNSVAVGSPAKVLRKVDEKN